METKQEDLKRLWEWIGLEYKYFPPIFGGTSKGVTGEYLDGKYCCKNKPPINLDTLYKFAIPKLQDKGYDIDLGAHRKGGFIANITHFTETKGKLLTNIMLDKKYESEYSDSPTEALYNAIMKVIDNER